MPGPTDALGGGGYKPPPPLKRGVETGQAFKANKSFYNKGFEPTKVPVPKLSSLGQRALHLEKEAFIAAAARGIMAAGRAAMPVMRAGIAEAGAARTAGKAMTPWLRAGASGAYQAAKPGLQQAGKALGKPMAVASAIGTGVGIGNSMATNGANGRSVYASDETLSKLAYDLSQIPDQDTNDALVTRLKMAQAGAAPLNPRDLGAILFHAIRR